MTEREDRPSATERPAPPLRDMLTGIGCWAAVAAVAIGVTGVVMDEATVPAQIISGVVTYPGGHPHDIYYKTVYSFTHLASAWFLRLWDSDVALSAFRNWLFLTLSLATPFALTLVLTRRPTWGHLAAALTMLGGHLLYQGVYPMWVFPDYYSQGHVGLHLVLLAGALIVGGAWRSGGLVAGAMPAMHAAMALTMWPWVAAYLLLRRISGDRAAVRPVLSWFGAGVLFSVAVALLIRFTSTPGVPVDPYDTLAGASMARAGFQAFTDAHRLEPGFITRAYLLNPVAFLAVGYLLFWVTRLGERAWTDRSADAAFVLGLGFCGMAIVYGVWLVYAAFGRLPEVVAMAMPWRFSNVTATLLIPVSVAAIAALLDRMPNHDAKVAEVVVALVVAAFGVAMAGLLGFSGRLAVERQMLAVFWGLPFGLGLWLIRSTPRQVGHLVVPMTAIMAAAAPFWSDSKAALYLAAATAACVTAAWAGRVLLARAALSVIGRARVPMTTSAIVVCAAGMLTARAVDVSRSGEADWERVSTADVTIDTWLAANAGADELVLAAVYPRTELQAKMRQPVLLEVETLFLMTYLPNLAPQIGTMVRELYGIDYERADAVARRCRNGLVRPWCEVWTEAWKSRPREEWIELARKYHFRFVVAPAEFGVDLPMRLQTARANVYEIPLAVEASAR